MTHTHPDTEQVGENRRVRHALRSLLEEFGCELREEEQRRLQLQQTYASERASWEIQRAEMRRCLAQVHTHTHTHTHIHTHTYALYHGPLTYACMLKYIRFTYLCSHSDTHTHTHKHTHIHTHTHTHT